MAPLRITLSASNRGGSRALLDDGTVLVESSPRPIIDAARELHGRGMSHDTPIEYRWNGQEAPFKRSTVGQCFRQVNLHNQEKIEKINAQAVQFWERPIERRILHPTTEPRAAEDRAGDGDGSRREPDRERRRGMARKSRWYPR